MAVDAEVAAALDSAADALAPRNATVAQANNRAGDGPRYVGCQRSAVCSSLFVSMRHAHSKSACPILSSTT